jgi:hypothetical protein
MRAIWIGFIAAMATFSAVAQPAERKEAAPATLDKAVLVISSADRSEVFLGEAMTLTLEYWEMKVRGLTVQPYYRGGNVTLPDMEGFFAGPLETEHDDAARDGALYSVTRYRQRLYPAVAGDLEIGPWRWQGSLRGYTAGGAQTQSVDLSTEAISVKVLPLPEPPSTFRGAVGEFEVSMALSATEMTQGTPASLTVSISGSGNPGTLEAPLLPPSEWYSADDPVEDGEPVPDPATGQFTKQFTYRLMPIEAGSFHFPAISLTYFSPAQRQYVSARTEPSPVRIAASGPAESLVVVGGGGASGPPLMEDGKLALVADVPVFEVRRERAGLWGALIALPPLGWLVVALAGGGWRGLSAWRSPRRDTGNLSLRFAALASAPEPLEGLNTLLCEVLPDSTSGMSDPELRDWLEARISELEAARIADAIQACRNLRYGQRAQPRESTENLIQGLPEALAALQAASVRTEEGA